MVYVSSKLILSNSNKGKSLFSLGSFSKDDLILEFERSFVTQATEYSLQIDENKHQLSSDKSLFENYINHSCDPNCYIGFKDLSFRALRDISKGEELTFNYNSTEWDMGKPIICTCGSKNCLGSIRGFKFLTFEQQKQLEPFLSPFLKKKFDLIKRSL